MFLRFVAGNWFQLILSFETVLLMRRHVIYKIVQNFSSVDFKLLFLSAQDEPAVHSIEQLKITEMWPNGTDMTLSHLSRPINYHSVDGMAELQSLQDEQLEVLLSICIPILSAVRQSNTPAFCLSQIWRMRIDGIITSLHNSLQPAIDTQQIA